MPDWSYRTVFRPVLFRLPAETARDLCLGVMGTLVRLPLGPACIDLLGHMRPPGRLARSFFGLRFSTPIGLGAGIDPTAFALPALARFGFGFLNIGPITLEPRVGGGTIERRLQQQSIVYPDPPANQGLAAMVGQLARMGSLPCPLIAQLTCSLETPPDKAGDECCHMIEALVLHVQLFALMTVTRATEAGWSAEQWREHVQRMVASSRNASPPRPLLVGVPPDMVDDDIERRIAPALETGVAGVLVTGGARVETGRMTGLPAREPTLRLVRRLRQRWDRGLFLIASGGVHEPAHALELFAAGADLVQIDSGLVYSGPGLPKRINDVLHCTLPVEETAAAPAAETSWFWALILGISMLAGGLLALAIASTRVVLPYDETFSGLSREQLAAANDRLLAFMAHDRVSLAGTMIAIGVLYVQFSLFGIRIGLHWARVAVLASAFAGFGSFFLFLGFGYFDPFHAFLTAILFQILLLALHAPMSAPTQQSLPSLREDWRWRLALWGQLLMVVQGAVLLVAGLVISFIGITSVFVKEDLEFMHTSADTLAAVSPRLLPLIAHDRASFGGMLIAVGLAVLLPTLWGWREGSAWLWWTLLLAGSAGYTAALTVHLAVGYTNVGHLLPAFAGFAVLLVGLALSYPFLCRTQWTPADDTD
jgi:dihydroorotate dehydrogenase